jgi:hypothetical protein
MAFHVEVRRSPHRARAFNLGEAELQQTVLEPWVTGRPLTLGDREWERQHAQLRILEGPELPSAELAHGQGWGRAERTARDVTAALLQASARVRAVAVLAPSPAAHERIARPLMDLGLEVPEWGTVRASVVAWAAGRGEAVGLGVDAVVLVCVREPPAWWLFDAGLALGACGPRALLVQCDNGPPPLRGLDVLRLDGGPDAPLGELAERLRRLGRA